MVSEISATPFHLSHQGLNDKSVQVLLSEAFSTLCPELLHTAANLPPPADKPAFRASLRIGFISAHFFEHSIGRILIGLIERMNSIHLVVDEGLPASKVEVFVFSVDRSLASDIPAEDISSLQSRLPRDGDQIVSLLSATIGDRYFRLPDNITTIRSFIEQTKLDFLMFADIGMDFSTYLLAFSRLAPFQVSGNALLRGVRNNYVRSEMVAGCVVGSSDHQWHRVHRLLLQPRRRVAGRRFSLLGAVGQVRHCELHERLTGDG